MQVFTIFITMSDKGCNVCEITVKSWTPTPWIYIKSLKSKTITKHSIRPNCKQTYNHKQLKDKKCPKCKVDVIDIKKYSKDNISQR